MNDRLTKEEAARYSRQLILEQFGVKGQLALRGSSVLVVGCGGLGCPVAAYLSAAGIGTLGLLDYDEVELDNLHRQILHSEQSLGIAKVDSVATSCSKINHLVHCIRHCVLLDSCNALEIFSNYDIIVDASDNLATRYLVNDACVLLKKPLVSGSALKFEGQLTVYNYNGGPCYRCLYPIPPPPETVTNCSDGGVIGAVVGVIGSLQAMETIKIAVRTGVSYAGRLLLYDGLEGMMKVVKLRSRQVGCAVCGDHPTITQLVDYVQFCGARPDDKSHEVSVLDDTERITVQDYYKMLENNTDHVLVDVRPAVELDICRLPHHAYNIPIDKIDVPGIISDLKPKLSASLPVFVICRRGNDSQLAAKKLQQHLADQAVQVKDIIGGLHAWAKFIDSDFLIY